VLLGGDHSSSIGSVQAILEERPNTAVVWVDAHADCNTSETSPSGNLHGMSVAFLLGLEDQLTDSVEFDWMEKEQRGILNPKNLVYIGLRDVDPGERKFIKKLGIPAFHMYDIEERGIKNIMEEVKSLLSGVDNIHMSYDVDVIDPTLLPHTGTPVEGGLSREEAAYVCEALASTDKLKSLEVVEINPLVESKTLDITNTLDMVCDLVFSALPKNTKLSQRNIKEAAA
jgi:arginase